MTHTLTTATITAWTDNGGLTQQIAARLAREIRSGALHRYAELPSDESLAKEFDASGRTARRAKKLLAEHGLLRKENGLYYVA
jgi:DNA-binding GntR family transcriptional regulator